MTTKRDIINRIAQATEYPKTRVSKVTELFLDEVIRALAEDGHLELRGFGVFRTVDLPARQGRNPGTGEAVDIPASRHVRFKAGKNMRDKLNSD